MFQADFTVILFTHYSIQQNINLSMVDEKQEAQKTLVAFVVGLLIGGMIVWAFSGPEANAPRVEDEQEKSTNTDEKKVGEATNETGASNSEATTSEIKEELKIGKGEVNVPDQNAGMSIKLDSATYPVSEGWIGVRDYNDDRLGMILGVVRFSEAQSLIPSEIILQRPTKAGNRYAIVIFSENGDKAFNLAGDVQIDTIFDTFVAQ